jgi:alpha-glucosidase
LNDVIYHVYVRSFQDSNGDGVGDIPGIVSRLDHLAWLGVDAVWLSPVNPSPNADWGYDVADYLGVDPALGTVHDLDGLIAEARARGIDVLLDLVPNHTSDCHPWFVAARSSRDDPKRDWYVWVDAPNNWVSAFGGPAWTLDETSGQYYLHNFLPQQPDLNWWNEDVRRAFDDILRYWFGRGVAGLRIDVVAMIVKDRELRDNPPATEDDHPRYRLLGQRQVYNSERPEVHDVIRRWRAIADACDPPRTLLGETHLPLVSCLPPFYGAGDELNMTMNIPFTFTRFDAGRMRTTVEETEQLCGADNCVAWVGSNHDVSRFPTRWCGGDERKVRCVLMMLLTLRGAALLYYGDEIGMPDTDITRDDVVDPVGLRYWPAHRGRDPERTPMHWSPTPGGGFTDAGVRPWLPFGDVAAHNVDDQRADPRSVLHLCRDLIAVRRRFRDAPYASMPAPDGAWAWRRGGDACVALNLSEDPVRVQGVEGTIAIGTDASRAGERCPGALGLGPFEGAVVLDEALG